jgi:hypothetical protein
VDQLTVLQSERSRVIVAGALDAAPFEARELTVAAADPDLTADVRALVYVAGDLSVDEERVRLVQFARRNLVPALDRGVAFVVATDKDQRNLAKSTLANTDRFERTAIVTSDSQVVAQACLMHDPGPFPDLQLSIEPSIGHAEIETLFRRAFRGFQRLTLAPLTGGRSTADGVWRVEAEASDKELRSPFVVKCGPERQIAQQLDTYRDVVADRIPFRGCAPICRERSIAGSTRQLSVSRFVENADRLDTVLADPSCPNVAELIERIYSGPLHRWRSISEKRTVSIFRQFISRNQEARYAEGLGRTFQKLEANGEDISDPATILSRLKALPKMEVPMCRAHDDLNIRNVFVTHVVGEIVLIDFTRAIVRPLSRDVARLDVGLAFDVELNEIQELNEPLLIEFFTHDLFAISLPHVVMGHTTRARLAAIQALRHRLLQEADVLKYDPALEYKVAVITELLYQAKASSKWSPAAYRCADSLSRSFN